MKNLHIKYKGLTERNYDEEDKKREYEISVNFACAMKINATS